MRRRDRACVAHRDSVAEKGAHPGEGRSEVDRTEDHHPGRRSQLLHLKQLLEPHRANKVVAEFLSCLGEAWRERMWLYQWLTRDEHSDPPGFGAGA